MVVDVIIIFFMMLVGVVAVLQIYRMGYSAGWHDQKDGKEYRG